MASGLNTAFLIGVVEGEVRYGVNNGQPLLAFRFNTIEKGTNGTDYPTQFMIITRGDLASNKHSVVTTGKRLVIMGTHEEGRVVPSADGDIRTNDFTPSNIIDPMTDDLNLVFLFGNLTKDAEVRNAESDRPFASTTLATNLHMGSNPDGSVKPQRTLYNRLTLNGKQALSLSPHLHKGDYVGMIGSYRYSKPYGKDGQDKKADIQFNVQSIIFGGSAKGGSNNGNSLDAQRSVNNDDLFDGLGLPPQSTEPAGAQAPVDEVAGEPAPFDINTF